MRINNENKSMDMEARDMNYILPAYVRSYLFYSKNQMPEKIIFPMFASVKVDNKDIPIEYVPPLDPVAMEIAKDGSSVAEVTPAQETVLDEKDEEIKRLKGEVKRLTEGGPEKPLEPDPLDILRQQEEAKQQLEDEIAEKELGIDTETPAESPAKAAFTGQPQPEEGLPPAPERQPKQPPGGDIGPGQPLSDTQPRSGKDQIQTAKDLREEPEVDETVEKPYEKEIKRDEQGRPIVEEPKEES